MNEMLNKSSDSMSFREFLNKSTGLFTVFGIFNALLIYSDSLRFDDAKQFLVPTFYLLSILVWVEIIVYSLDSSNKSFQYKLFYVLACAVLIGLTWYFMATFGSILIGLGIAIAPLAIFYILARFSIILLTPYLKKKIKKNWIILFIEIFIAIIPTMIVVKYGFQLLVNAAQ